MFQAFERFVARLGKPKSQPERLELTEEGLAIFVNGREDCRFRWADVSKMVTYKCDLVTTDLICLEFAVHEKPGVVYAIHEEMEGFDQLRDFLSGYFPSIPPDWWREVLLPPFAPNYRILYERASLNHPSA